MTFDHKQPREADGKFGEKTGTAPDVLLSHESETLVHKLPDSPKVGGVHEHGTETIDPSKLMDVHEALKGQPPLYGRRIEDFIIDDDEDDEPYDASRKFSSLRSYPGMNGIPVNADLLHGMTMDDLHGRNDSDVLFVTEDGYEIQEATDGYAAYDADGNFVTGVMTASDDHDSIEDAFREQMAELKAASGE